MKTQPTYQVGSANKPGGKKHHPSETKKKKKPYEFSLQKLENRSTS